ncbi:MAG: lipoyl(octanoyl) transferase LipB [Ignavibacteriaceae bacterium]|nr:lipoyl(octanoyl) transferase LipB [Ignavibacteriaceae bacterium]
MKELLYSDLNIIDYKEAWDLQREIFELRYKKEISDILLLLEHPHTYTLGRIADKAHMISSPEFLDANKISVYDIDRGGDITYHGPGQIVGYPIIDLGHWQKDTHKYLRGLEEVIIRTCAVYGISAIRDPKYTGVWVENRKIAAIGIKVSRWITMHGFAFNINSDLSFFNGIVPCGIVDKEVTSLKKELDRDIDIHEVKKILLDNFKLFFEYDSVNTISKEDLLCLHVTAKG